MKSISEIVENFADGEELLSFSVCEKYILISKTVNNITLDMVMYQDDDNLEHLHTFPYGSSMISNIIEFVQNDAWGNTGN